MKVCNAVELLSKQKASLYNILLLLLLFWGAHPSLSLSFFVAINGPGLLHACCKLRIRKVKWGQNVAYAKMYREGKIILKK